MSLFGAKAEIAVREKRLQVVIERVPFGISRRYDPKHPDVLRANPKGQVPVLIDGPLELYDSTQIFEYLEDAYPEPALWPAEPRARALARQLEHESDEVVFPHVAKLMVRATGEDDPVHAAARQQIATHCRRLEARLAAGGPFLCGAYSFADIAVFMTLLFAEALGAPLSDAYPRLHLWRARVLARPAVAEVAVAMAAYMGRKGFTPLRFVTDAAPLPSAPFSAVTTA